MQAVRLRCGVNVDETDVIPRCAVCRQPVVVLRMVRRGEVVGRVAVDPTPGIAGDVTYDPARHTRHERTCRDAWARPRPAETLAVAA